MIAIGITELWMAILLSAVVVWVASALVWMVLPHHKKELKGLPNESAALDALRPQNLAPGQYNIPHCQSWDDAKKPEVIEKFNNGPVAILRVFPNGMPNMPKNLILSFVFYIIIGVIVAYIVTRTVAPGADYLAVFRIAGVVTWLAYGMGSITDAIWFGLPWASVAKIQFDSLLYALLTAGVFGWQWQSLTG